MTGSSLVVIGASHDSALFHCKHIAERIAEGRHITVEFSALLEIDFMVKLADLKRKHGGNFNSIPVSSTHCVYTNQHGKLECIGEMKALVEYATNMYELEDPSSGNTAHFEHAARIETSKILQSTGNPVVYVDFIDGGKRTAKSPEYGKVIIELYDSLCPKASANFVKLCTQQGPKEAPYLNCPIHRLVPGGWLQCGDTVDGSGNNSVSAMASATIEDESFSVSFDHEFGGLVGYVTSAPHSNGSQFFITLGPCPWMNQKFEGFGRVVQGYDALKRIEKAACKNQRPTPSIKIGGCGKQGISH